VFFKAKDARSLLGFEKGWHEGDGAGGGCQVHRRGCEIILCEDATPPLLAVRAEDAEAARDLLKPAPDGPCT